MLTMEVGRLEWDRQKDTRKELAEQSRQEIMAAWIKDVAEDQREAEKSERGIINKIPGPGGNWLDMCFWGDGTKEEESEGDVEDIMRIWGNKKEYIFGMGFCNSII